jgi:hypothetical protein
MNNKSSLKTKVFIKPLALACACEESKTLKSLKDFGKRSEYNRNYYQKHREEIIKKHLEYYHENKEYINNRNKEYFINYYQQNKQRILTRVQNNYYLKVGRSKKPDRIILDPSGSIKSSTLKNEILENNIVISLMD